MDSRDVLRRGGMLQTQKEAKQKGRGLWKGSTQKIMEGMQ